MPYQQDCTVLNLQALNSHTYELLLEAGGIAEEARPGQFVNVSCGEGRLLRRPISICETSAMQLRLVFEVRGAGTEWLSRRDIDDQVSVLGPLGRGFDAEDKRVLFIGGGIGVPPLLWAAEGAEHADAALGFARADRVILADDFSRVCTRALIATDDGSMGVHGTAMDAANRLLAEHTYDLICACGPKPLLKAAAEAAAKAGIPCQVSMEERMGCGVGACLVCAVPLRDKNGQVYYGHVCKDGPVFFAQEVVFDD